MLAFWELNHIARSLPARRKAIFVDVDQKPTNTFEQLKKECLNVLGEVDSKLNTSRKSPGLPVETSKRNSS
jgi:nucleoporin NDC1